MFPTSTALQQTREVREKELQAKSLKIAVAVVFMAGRPNGVHVASEDSLVAGIHPRHAFLTVKGKGKRL
jgi:hypothetical protein